MADLGFGALMESITGMQQMQEEITMTGQELMNLRATFLFTAFGGMALAQMITTVTEKFDELREQMVDTWSEIGYQATTVSTILRGTGEVAGQVSDRMLELGRKTEWTAVEAGEAMENLSRAGLDLDATMGSVKPVMDLATASTIDLAGAAKFAAGAYRGWGLEAEKTIDIQQNVSMVAAEVTHAARKSRQEVDELAQAFKYATATARTIGWSMEELTSGLMITANSMISAGMAGRSFRRIMTRVGKIAGTVSSGIQSSRERIDKLGISLKDSEGNIVGFAEMVERLNKATADLTKTQELNLYQQIAGMRGMNALAVATDEGAEAIRQQTVNLKASAVAQALWTKHGNKARKMMEEINKQVRREAEGKEGTIDATKALIEEYGLSEKAALKYNQVLNDTIQGNQSLEKAMENLTLVSEMAREKLNTLKGTQILLKSSTEALWAELAQGSFAQVMMVYKRFVRSVTDALAQMPGVFKTIIAFIVLFMSAVGKTIPSMLMFTAMIQIQQAALASLKLEMHEMAKTRLDNANLAMFENSVVQNQIYTYIENANTKQWSKTVDEMKSLSLQQLIFYIQQEEYANWSNIRSKITSAQKTQIQAAMDKNLTMTKSQLTQIVHQQKAAMGALSKTMLPMIGRTLLLMGAMGLLMHAFTQGDERLMAFATGLGGLVVVMKWVQFSSYEMGTAIAYATMNFTAFAGTTAFTYLILKKWSRQGKAAIATAFSLAGAILLIAIYMNALDKSMGGIITAIGLLANGLIIITDLIWGWTDGIMKVDKELTGNTLLDSILSVANAIGILAKPIKWIMELFNDLWEKIDSVGLKFDWLAGLSDTLMGHSVIPENFERGVKRIKNTMSEMRSDMNFGIAEGFGKRQSTIVSSKPRFELDLSNFTTKKEVEPEELQRLVSKGVEESLEKWERHARRTA